MQLFGPMYDWAIRSSKHKHAPYYLSVLSFAESSFFPIPPDVMLAPMSIAKPKRAFYFAFITTLASVLGGILGYFIGLYFFEWIEPVLHQLGYWDKFLTVKEWFVEWGFWAVFLAGLSPIPYKLFTVSAGVLSMALLPFIAASIVGRGARFFLVAALMAYGGAKLEAKLRPWIERIGWAVVGLAAILYFFLRH